jgi:hypothetical protein
MELNQNIKENISELLKQARSSSDQNKLIELSKNVNPTIRREVARNSFTPVKLLKRLAEDCVANVSYMALQNPQCNIKRVIIDENHPCVSCTIDPLQMDCSNCQSIINFKNR